MDPYGLRNSGDIRWPRGVRSQTGMWNKTFAWYTDIRVCLRLQPPFLARSIQKNKEKVSWRAGKTTKTYDLGKKNQWIRVKYSKIEFRVAGANQDVTSTRRCDLSQDPSILMHFAFSRRDDLLSLSPAISMTWNKLGEDKSKMCFWSVYWNPNFSADNKLLSFPLK